MTRVVDVALEEVRQSPLEQGGPNRENTSDIFFFAAASHDPAKSRMCLNSLGKVFVYNWSSGSGRSRRFIPLPWTGMNCATVLLMIGSCTRIRFLVDLCVFALNDFGARCYEGLVCLLQGLTGEIPLRHRQDARPWLPTDRNNSGLII